MKKIYFRKTTTYDLGKGTQDVFEYLQKIGLQTIDPKPLTQFQSFQDATIIFCSSLSRVKDSLPLHTSYKIHELDELREVLFNLKLLCTEEEFTKEGSIIIRRKFKEFFIKDQLPVTRKLLFSEI